MSAENQVLNYFAYGSNMSLKRMKARNIEFVFREPCLLDNYQLVFNVIDDEMRNPSFDSQKGYANIYYKTGGTVEGFIYGISEIDLKHLAKLEAGYQPIDVSVKTKDSKKTSAVTFTGNPDAISEGLIPPSWYMNYLIDGAVELSIAYREYLKSIAVLNEDERS